MFLNRVTIICVCVNFVHGLRLPLSSGSTHTEHTDVVITHGGRSRRHVADEFPQEINIQITVARELVSMDLSRNTKRSPDDVPLYVHRDGKATQIPLPAASKEYALYQNTDSGSAFLVTHSNDVNQTNNFKEIFGTFRHNSSFYAIQPTNDTTQLSNKHMVAKIPDQKLTFDVRQPQGPDYEPLIRQDEIVPEHLLSNRRIKRQVEVYEIELFSVVDYANFLFWYDLANNNIAETYRLIHEYNDFLVHSVDSMYKTISSGEFIIYVLNAGVFIADNAGASPWSEDSAFDSKIVTDTALTYFTAWVEDQTSLPDVDHFMALTGYDAVSDQAGSDSSGMAYSKALCTSKATSIVEQSFNFITMTTAAHELGHSLGAGHDGDSNKCSGSDNFIMASVNSISGDPAITQNMWVFSDCSVTGFESYIAQLDRTRNNCMLSTSSGSRIATTSKPMAEVYGPDETCVNTFGAGSYVCRSIQKYDSICTSMFCNKPGTTHCYSILPAEGTSCGQGKWCEKGQCVESSRAPADNNDDCPIGDRPGLFDNSDKTCEEWIDEEPGRCYGSYTGKTCCKSCHAYRTADESCLYGDSNRTICESISKIGCYRNEDFCCGTCKPLADESKPNCKYGDKYVGCLRADCDDYLPVYQTGCCDTCHDPSQTTPTTTTTRKTTTKTTTRKTTTPSTTTSTSTTSTTTATTPVTTTSTARTTPKTRKTTTTADKTTPTRTTPRRTETRPITYTGVETTVIPTTSETPGLVIIAVGCGAGVVVVVVLIVVVCVIIRKRRAKMAEHKPKSTKDNSYDNIGFLNLGSKKPNHPPPRRGSNSSQQHSGGVAGPDISIINDRTFGDHPDGYMKPIHLTTANGVQYSAPNKPKKPLVPPKKYGDDTLESNKRQSKPVHYKKTGNTTHSGEINHFAPYGLQSGDPPVPVRKFSDAYDSIGELQQALQYRRPTLPQNHPSTLRSNKSASGDSSDISGRINSTTSDSIADNVQKNAKPLFLPPVAPRPVPRPKGNSFSENVNDRENKSNDLPANSNAQTQNFNTTNGHTSSFDIFNNGYDQADSVQRVLQQPGGLPLLPMKPLVPPQKPVPRRQVSETNSFDSQSPTPLPRPLKPPMKPVPRRQISNENLNSGHNNPSFNIEDNVEIQI